MSRSSIQVDNLKLLPFFQWDKKWFLLTAGDYKTKQFNTMTISWGSIGVMWNRPFVQVVVRPTRYTFEFIERHDTFTVCAFAETYRDALQLLGSKSGRDGNKIVESGLHPIGSKKVSAPSFAEAELIIECQKIYMDDFEPKHFLDQTIDRNYPNKDYHRIYYGQILHIEGEEIYRGE